MKPLEPAQLQPPRPSRGPGKGRRWIPSGLAALAAALAIIIYVLRPSGEATYVPRPVHPTSYAPAARAVPANVRFVDITEEAGIRFRHTSGARGKRLLPETMGSGCAFLDFDADGDQDLLFVNSSPWPGDSAEPPPTQALYENDGVGRFRDVTAEKGLAVTFYGMGVAAGDFDGDGWEDVFITAVGGDRLFRNLQGKRFEEVTQEAGIPSEGPNTWSSGAAFLDYDCDGLLDLLVCRYVEWSPEIDLAQDFQITGIGRAYGPPQNFAGAFSRLYRNAGGRFVDASRPAGIEVVNPHTGKPMGKTLGIAVGDIDDDGYPDIALANDTVQNFLFHNQKDGTFKEIGVQAGFAFDATGNARGAMGIDWADLEGPGSAAIVVGNFAGEITALYRSSDPRLLPFSDDAVAEGIGNPSRKYLKFGVFFFDFDLDGRLDIFESNGHLEPEIASVQGGQTYAQPAQIFWNAGPGAPRGFEVLDSAHLGPDIFQPAVGRGCAYADVDGDGDLDVACTSNGGPARLFRNDGGSKNGWIRLKLVGTKASRSALGARVEAEVEGGTLRARLGSGRSYLSQCESVVTLGLGSSPRADRVRVFWPGQTAGQEIGSLPAGTRLVVTQP